MQHFSFCDCLISHSITSSRSIYVVTYGRIYFLMFNQLFVSLIFSTVFLFSNSFVSVLVFIISLFVLTLGLVCSMCMCNLSLGGTFHICPLDPSGL